MGIKSFAIIALLASGAADPASSNENVGSTRSPLVTSNQPVSVAEQERLGLVTLSSGCSGVLLNNSWLATAAHCVIEERTAPGKLTVTANWRLSATSPYAAQQVRAAAIYTGWGDSATAPAEAFDVALVRLASPIAVNQSTAGFSARIANLGLADLKDKSIRAYGRGINVWASDSGNGPTQASTDNRFRRADFKVSGQRGETLFEFKTTSGSQIAGGDSGGPSFLIEDGQPGALVGVHALAGIDCLKDKTCAEGDWTWVAGSSWAADAPLSSLRGAISEILPQSWDPAIPVHKFSVRHSEAAFGKSLLLGQIDTVPWAYAQRAAHTMCLNRGFVAGFVSGTFTPNVSYEIICFGPEAGRYIEVDPLGVGSFRDPNAVDWAQSGRDADAQCRTFLNGSRGGFHTGFHRPARGSKAALVGVFCLYDSFGSWTDLDAASLGAAADLRAVSWVEARRRASTLCGIRGFPGGFLNGHQGEGVRGAVCIGTSRLLEVNADSVKKPTLPPPSKAYTPDTKLPGSLKPKKGP